MRKIFGFLVFSIILGSIISFATVSAVTITNPLSSNTFEELLGKIIAIVTGIIGTLGVIMLIVAGILFVISGGSPEKINSAKKAFIYAVMGIAISLAAWAIVNTVKFIIGTTP